MRISLQRARLLNTIAVARPGPVMYWMSRDQRVRDNWALVYAQEQALRTRQPLVVVFCLVPDYAGAALRQYDFMLRGLRETEDSLKKKGIPLFVGKGDPAGIVPALVRKLGAGFLVCDFDPIRQKRRWKQDVSRDIAVPMHEVDAHNIVPCWLASQKEEFGAHTLRPKLQRMLPAYLTVIPPVKKHPFPFGGTVPRIDWERLRAGISADRSVAAVPWPVPGETAARRMLSIFLKKKLGMYGGLRNDPVADGQSGISAYLHFGQLSAQAAALAAAGTACDEASKQAFLDQLIVRRELADNFCYYNTRYDSVAGAHAWAARTLREHAGDRREYRYSLKVFESARTHDSLWNAAQMQMASTGKMHGYLRMYWAKKILEWSGSPEEAFGIAVYLNDRYELDGRDPNGYAGISWSICGTHDRPWFTRGVFGAVRYMSRGGCEKKFDAAEYIRRWGARG